MRTTRTSRVSTKEQEPRIVVGEADVDPELPSHVPGVAQGNWPSRRMRRRRDTGTDPTLRGDARRSTGIRPSAKEPIDPRMPKIPPP